MSVFLFKNLYIFERGNKETVKNPIVGMLCMYNLWFPKKLFTVETPNDKIVLFFENNFLTHQKLVEINIESNVDIKNFIGCIKFYTHANGIRVFHVNFHLDKINEHLKIFRDYVLELVKIHKYKSKISLDKYNFTLHWDCNIDTNVKNILIENKLLNSRHLYHKYYFFSEKDIS